MVVASTVWVQFIGQFSCLYYILSLSNDKCNFNTQIWRGREGERERERESERERELKIRLMSNVRYI